MKKFYAQEKYEQVIRDGKDFINSLSLTKEQKDKYEIYLTNLLKLIAETTRPGIEGKRAAYYEIQQYLDGELEKRFSRITSSDGKL